MKHRIFLDINLRHWKYEKYCGGWMLLGHWYAAAAHSRLTPGSFNNRKTEKLDILTSGTLASRGRPERDLWSPGCGLRRWRRRSANLVWIPIQRDLIVNPLAPQSHGWWLVLVLHFTRPLLHKKHPPPLPSLVLLSILRRWTRPASSQRGRPGGSWGYCSEVRLLMIISDNPPPHWPVLADYRQDEPGRGGSCGGGEAAWPPLATGHLSPLAAITQINKLSESHINLTTSEAIEAMCHLRVLHTHWPPPSSSPLILTMRWWQTFANATVSSHHKPETKSCFQLKSPSLTKHWFAERLRERNANVGKRFRNQVI